MYVYTTYLFTVYVWEEFLCTCSKYLSLYLSSKSCSVHVYLIYILNMSFSIFFFTTYLFSICTCEKIAGKWFKVLHQNTWSFLLVNQFWQQRHTQTVTKAAETWMDSILLLLNMAVCILFSSAKDCARADTSMLAVFLNKQIKESKVRKWKRGN